MGTNTKKDYLASKSNNIKFIWAKYGLGICDCYDDYIDDITDLIEKLEQKLN